MKNYYKCPHCGKVNEVSEASWDENLAEKLPINLAKAALITVAGVATGGIGGVILGGILYGDSVIKYVNGTKVTCGSCGYDFSI